MTTHIEPVLINNAIRSHQVRLIGPDGSQIGIFTTREALSEAYKANLDLVTINGDAQPPVCKIVDYNKWNYERQQLQKELARKQRAATKETKEVQLRPTIAEHDLSVKLARASNFIADGNQVLVKVKLKGRERSHKNLIEDLLATVINRMGEIEIIQPARDLGRDWTMLLGPSKKKKVQEPTHG